ncbi:MAG: rod shape-determining protein RodA [Patescibacteria group bacterium]
MATLRFRQLGRGLDLGLLTVTLLLTVIGLGALFSTSLNAEPAGFSIFYRQLSYVLIGLGVIVFFTRLDYRYLGGIHWVLYLVGMAMLIAVRLFGRTVNGTTGWFEIAGFQLQPVEFVKIIVGLVLAKYFADHLNELQSWRVIFVTGALVVGPIVLVMLQPDLGSAMLLFGIWFGLLVALPVPRRRVGLLLLLTVVGAVASWFLILQPYQKERVLIFISPNRDRLGSGYNVQQAITAIGSGQIFGRGLGLGPQSQLNFLPERHTDFIFAAISEELGFVGAGTILLLFTLLFWRFFGLSQRCRDTFSAVLTMALALMFFVQVAINIGMNLGVFPVTGIPLPFISYGGSSLLSSLMAIGIAESIAIRQRIIPL